MGGRWACGGGRRARATLQDPGTSSCPGPEGSALTGEESSKRPAREAPRWERPGRRLPALRTARQRPLRRLRGSVLGGREAHPGDRSRTRSPLSSKLRAPSACPPALGEGVSDLSGPSLPSASSGRLECGHEMLSGLEQFAERGSGLARARGAGAQPRRARPSPTSRTSRGRRRRAPPGSR